MKCVQIVIKDKILLAERKLTIEVQSTCNCIIYL